MTKLNSLIKVAMVATGIAACAAQARAVNVSYVDGDGTTKQADATVVAAIDSRVTWQAGWYVVTNEVTVKGGAGCSGAVHLILADTGKLTISGVAGGKAGIAVSGSGNSLAIYGQAAGTGALTVSGGASSAGIGGGEGSAGSDITINGGTVTANGRDGGAGIGGGYHGLGSNIRINGGKVTATGGTSSASGIGSGDGGGDASKIYAADDVIVKAGTKANPTTEIAHLGDQDISYDLEEKQYATAVLLAKVTVDDVAGATAKVYANEVEITERPAKIEYGTAFDVVYTADAGKMFPGGYKTYETNLTANAAAITVAVPAGQQPVEATTCEACLTFSADAAFGIKMWRQGTPAEPNLECSQDQIYWSKFDLGNGAAAGADNKLYLRGTGNQQFAKDTTKCYTFTNTTDSAATAIACSGNTLTLLDYETVAKGKEPSMGDYAFFKLFSGFAALTTAPELPATNLTTQCYCNMFRDCTSLTTAPALPATKLTGLCYLAMFYGCTSLTDAPELPATTLEKQCYSYMFMNCTALTDVPALPATNLAFMCYGNMFNSCTALEVNTNGTGKAWSIPSEAAASVETAQSWNKEMFKGTTGNITNTVVTPGTTYYVASAPVTVVVPEVAGATAQLYAFKVNGGWRAVATNKVPRNAAVRVVWTADEGKGLWTNGVESAYQWQTAFGPVVGGEVAPAPQVREAGASVVTVDLDTRADKRYFDAADVLPIWYAQGSEVKVQGEGEQSWDTLVKSSANTNTLAWKPTEQGVYTLSHTAFENATITFTTPVEVTTNGLEVAKTTVQVTDDGGNPLVAQTEGEFKGKIIVPSNSTVKVSWTATEDGTYFADGSTTYTATFAADKPVNDAATEIASQKPAEPKAPSVKLGTVAQCYPWNGFVEVEYKAMNVPPKKYHAKVTVEFGGVKKDFVKSFEYAKPGITKTSVNFGNNFGQVKGEAVYTIELVEDQPN